MQKLTNEKARELLKELQYAKAAMGQLSIRDEYFKQALERVVAGAPEGWRLVPLEATKNMRDSYYEASVAPISKLSMTGYNAMVAAAQETPI